MPHRFPPLRPPVSAARKDPAPAQALHRMPVVDICLLAALVFSMVILFT